MSRRFEKDYIKRVIPKDNYLATIVHAEFRKNKFYLWWVIDTGKYIGQKISEKFPCTEFGDEVLLRTARRLRINYRPTVTKPSKIFPLQFICKRGEISVDIKHIKGEYTRNIITYHQVALSPPEENVAKPKSVEHFFKEKSGRKLPL